MTKPDRVTIAGRPIGGGCPPYVIAELSANHNGELSRALALVAEAKAAGADAIKLQTYTADTITIDHDGPGFLLTEGLWRGRTLYDLYQEASTPWEWHEALFNEARRVGIAPFSSPFDPTAVDFLESMDVPAYKVASFELVDIPLVERIADTGKPMIMSTGMASLEEIADAVDAARRSGNDQIVLLHCVSGYPTPPEECNLRTMADLAERFGVLTGLSDHTLGTAVPVAATALGAAVIEKHFTLRRADGGPDSTFSLEPEELATMVADCTTAHAALGRPTYGVQESERQYLSARRSLYVVADVAAGAPFTPKNLRSIRPGFGLPPKHLASILGRSASRDLKRGTPLDWTMVREGERE